MKLIIDIGNTQAKLALFTGQEQVHVSVHTILSEKIIDPLLQENQVSAVILATVKKYPIEISRLLNRPGLTFIELSKETRIPVKNLYRSPGTLGYDRLAAIVGAYSLHPNQNTLVIDAGTCVTYDFINAQNEYIGGSISPGIRLRLKALHEFTDRLPLIEYRECDKLTGTTTEESILTGISSGILAEVESFINQYSESYTRLNVILTGGDATFFDKKLKSSIFVAPYLVLKGLNGILDFNLKTANEI